MACKARMLQKRGFSHSLGVQLTPAFGGGIYSVFKKVLNLHEEAVSRNTQRRPHMADQPSEVSAQELQQVQSADQIGERFFHHPDALAHR